MHRSTSKDEKRRAKEKREALLLEGLESGAPTEMTQRDWEEIRRKALRSAQGRQETRMNRVLIREQARRGDFIEPFSWWAENAGALVQVYSQGIRRAPSLPRQGI